jgi:hypothetical protein
MRRKHESRMKSTEINFFYSVEGSIRKERRPRNKTGAADELST